MILIRGFTKGLMGTVSDGDDLLFEFPKFIVSLSSFNLGEMVSKVKKLLVVLVLLLGIWYI